jgi:hypothetical protein
MDLSVAHCAESGPGRAPSHDHFLRPRRHRSDCPPHRRRFQRFHLVRRNRGAGPLRRQRIPRIHAGRWPARQQHFRHPRATRWNVLGGCRGTALRVRPAPQSPTVSMRTPEARRHQHASTGRENPVVRNRYRALASSGKRGQPLGTRPRDRTWRRRTSCCLPPAQRHTRRRLGNYCFRFVSIAFDWPRGSLDPRPGVVHRSSYRAFGDPGRHLGRFGYRADAVRDRSQHRGSPNRVSVWPARRASERLYR